MSSVLTVTLNPALDVTTSVEALEPHVKLRCGPATREPGGGGINVSRMIKKLGGETCAFVCIGGVIGEHLQVLIEEAGVACHAFAAPGITRESLQVVEKKSGHQFRFIMPGPQWDEASAKDMEAQLDRVIAEGDYGWVVASGSIPPGMPTDIYARLARRARAHDAKFILDSSGEALVEGLKAPVFLVKPDRKEVAELAKALGCEESGVEGMAGEIVAGGAADAMIYTRGEKGAVLVTSEGTRAFRPPDVEVKSLTGAGDSFLAAVIWSLSNGEDLAKATQWGVAAASAVAQTEGTALASLEEVERCLKGVAPD